VKVRDDNALFSDDKAAALRYWLVGLIESFNDNNGFRSSSYDVA
jgi:hypothetical protein